MKELPKFIGKKEPKKYDLSETEIEEIDGLNASFKRKLNISKKK